MFMVYPPASSAPPANPFDRAAKRLPAGFTGSDAESFFWSLPGARDDEPGEIPKQLSGVRAFRIKVSTGAASTPDCEWSATVGTDRVTVKAPPGAASGSFCLAFTRQVRTRPVTSPAGETVQVQETYEKLFSVKTNSAAEVEAIQKALTGGELLISVERSLAAEASRVAALLVGDVAGTPGFEMSEGDAQPGKNNTPVRRNNYLIPGTGIEIWLFDKKSGEVIAKKILHP